jgi:Lipase (class 3)
MQQRRRSSVGAFDRMGNGNFCCGDGDCDFGDKMISDVDLAALCTGIYAYPGSVPISWDHFDAGDDGDRVCWGLKRVGGDVALILRGSVTEVDWFRDLAAVTNPFHHDDIGPVHPGFLSGMRTIERELGDLVAKTEPLYIAGHSLGAGRAAILVGLLTIDGWKPEARVVFGEPKPGFSQLADIIGTVPGRSYRNGDDKHHDPVTDVPFSFPPEQFVHPTPVIQVTARPTPGLFGLYGIFGWHHMTKYQEALGTPASETTK